MAPQRFEAVVTAEGPGVFVEVPVDMVAALGAGRRPAVVVEINGYRWRSTPAVYGGRCYLPLRKEVRQAAGIEAGQTVTVGLELDEGPRDVALPDDLAAALREDPTVEAAFAALSFTHRKEYVEWVEAARRDDTRRRRVERTVEILRPGPKDC
ncbi:MAG TPA: YdeI/OmpD-associated family protein [Candidatus Dormibacteraeota bacterium]